MSDQGSLTNFLQNSILPPAPTAATSSTSSPLWLSDYLYNTLGAASNLAQQPYPQFPGPLVAAPSSQTQQSWNLAGQNVNAYQPDLATAQSLVSQGASPITADQIQTFLNPYQQYVTNALDTNLQQNVLPQIQSQFVSAGQAASPQQAQIAGQAAYGTQQAVGQALAQGYQGALSSLLQQKGLQETAGGQYGQLGALTSELGLQNVGELAASGSAQDQFNQANLNAAYQQFQNQAMWPYQQVGFMSDVARGLPVSAAGTSTTTAGSTYPGAYAYGPSPLSILAGASGQNAALGGTGVFARGGHVRHGPLTKYAGGGAAAGGTPEVGGLSGGAPTATPGWGGVGPGLQGASNWIGSTFGALAPMVPGYGVTTAGADILNNPNPNYASDFLTGLGDVASLVPGIGGLIGEGMQGIGSLLPGGTLNSDLFGYGGVTPDIPAQTFNDPLGGAMSTDPVSGSSYTSPGLVGNQYSGVGGFLNDVFGNPVAAPTIGGTSPTAAGAALASPDTSLGTDASYQTNTGNPYSLDAISLTSPSDLANLVPSYGTTPNSSTTASTDTSGYASPAMVSALTGGQFAGDTNTGFYFGIDPTYAMSPSGQGGPGGAGAARGGHFRHGTLAHYASGGAASDESDDETTPYLSPAQFRLALLANQPPTKTTSNDPDEGKSENQERFMRMLRLLPRETWTDMPPRVYPFPQYADGGAVPGGTADDLSEPQDTPGGQPPFMPQDTFGSQGDDLGLTSAQQGRAYGVAREAMRRTSPQGTLVQNAMMQKRPGIPPMGAVRRMVIPRHGPAYQDASQFGGPTRSTGYRSGGAFTANCR